MKTLHRRVMWRFVAVVLPLAAVISVLDSLFEVSADRVTDGRAMWLLLGGYLFAQLIVFALATLLFARLIGRVVAAENARYAHAKSALFADIAHDLKTPLTSVIGFSKALMDDKAADEAERREMLELVHRKAVHMGELLERMSQMALLDGENVPMRMETVDLSAVVREAVAMHYPEFEDAGIRIEIDIPDQPVMARLDAREFSRALSNLLINAYRHNAPGATALVRLKRRGGRVRVLVADTGPTIPESEAQHIFEPFVRGDASRTGPGNGLGLSISSRIAANHGGSLTLERGPQGYTKAFVIELQTA